MNHDYLKNYEIIQ